MHQLRKILQNAVFVCLAVFLAGCDGNSTDSVKTDVTIYVSGELLERGGVIVVYPLPVSEERWKSAIANHVNTLPPPSDLSPISRDGSRLTLSLTQPFYQVQFLYPEGRGNYVFHFRSLPDGKNAPQFATRLITVGGIDEDTGYGEAMTDGFIGLPTSGMQIIQINTDGITERAARVLAGMREDINPKPLLCETTSVTAKCTYSPVDWPVVRLDWQKGIEALDKEYRRMETLNKCYRTAESEGKTGGSCVQTSADSDEAVYEYRSSTPQDQKRQ